MRPIRSNSLGLGKAVSIADLRLDPRHVRILGSIDPEIVGHGLQRQSQGTEGQSQAARQSIHLFLHVFGLSVRAGRGSGLVLIPLCGRWRRTGAATAAPAATRRLARSRHFSEAAVQIPDGDSYHRDNNKDLDESIHDVLIPSPVRK